MHLPISVCLSLVACACAEQGIAITAAELDAAPCTAASITAPPPGFTGMVGWPLPLLASATCPPGVTPEFLYLRKALGAPNWTTLQGVALNLSTAQLEYVPGAATYTPAVGQGQCFSVGARATGSGVIYQARSSGVCGTVNDSPVVTMTVPARLFASNEATIDALEGTPIIGANVEATCLTPTQAVACIIVGGIRQCGMPAPCGAVPAPIGIAMYELAVTSTQRITVSIEGGGVVATGGLIAMRALPDPL
jgi:hypothetical protein